MSRCFPYPPPGYVRNPVAVAEAETTAKLQKGKEKAEKKKEKRSDRKGLQQGESSKHSKHSHKKRKHEDIGKAGQDPKTFSKESVEQLEKSGLSEEHGTPCFVRTIRDSPESSQDSSKRRKVTLPSPSQAKNGNILRIKIRRDQDPPRGVEQPTVKLMGSGSSQLSKPKSIQQHNKVNVNSAAAAHQRINVEPRALQKQEQPTVKLMGLGSSQLSKPKSIQQHDKVNVNSAAAAHQRINVEPQALQKQASTQHPSKFIRDDQQMVKVVQQIDPMLSAKPPVVRVDLLPVKVGHPLVKVSQRNLPGKVVPAKVLHRVEAQVPSAEIQKKCPPVYPKVSQEVSTPAINHLQNVQPALVQNLKLEATGTNQVQRPITSVSKEEPSSARNEEAAQRHEAKQSKSDKKKSRKAEKKEKKFRDLFVTWNPPPLEMEVSDVCEQDWLFGSTRNSDASMTNCRASDGSVPFQSMEQQPCLQPRATFLPDLHIYQLPYVVPF